MDRERGGGGCIPLLQVWSPFISYVLIFPCHQEDVFKLKRLIRIGILQLSNKHKEYKISEHPFSIQYCGTSPIFGQFCDLIPGFQYLTHCWEIYTIPSLNDTTMTYLTLLNTPVTAI